MTLLLATAARNTDRWYKMTTSVVERKNMMSWTWYELSTYLWTPSLSSSSLSQLLPMQDCGLRLRIFHLHLLPAFLCSEKRKERRRRRKVICNQTTLVQKKRKRGGGGGGESSVTKLQETCWWYKTICMQKKYAENNLHLSFHKQ